MVQLLDALKDVSLTSLDISSTGCGISTASKLAELMSGATKFSAAVESIDLSGCGLTGATKDDYGDWQNIDSNMDGFIALCAVLGKVRTVRLADCALGASSVVELSKIFSDATAALTELDVRRNVALDGAALAKLRAAAAETCKILPD